MPNSVDRTVPPLRILHVIHGLTVGGAEVDLLHKTRWAIRHRNHEVTVCCLMQRGELAEEFETAGARVVGPLMRHRYDVGAARSIRRIVLSTDWDIIHSHLFEASLVLWLASLPTHRALRGRWLASEHSMASASGAAAILMDGRFLRTALCLTVPTEAARASFLQRGLPERNLRVLPNAVDVDRFPEGREAAARETGRRCFGIDPEVFVAGTVCRLHPIKALPTLIRAVAALPMELLIAGDGPERGRLELLIKSLDAQDRIHLLGPRVDVPKFLAAIDVFALPSDSESFGLAVAEALTAGTPVVATRTGGIPELTGDGRFARLVPPGDAMALRDALLWALEHRAEHESMALRGSRFVRERWGVEAVGERLDALYREVIAED